MDYVLQETLKSFLSSPTKLTNGNIARIKEEFPVPREQRVLWADVKFASPGVRISGLVLTDTGLFAKGGKEVLVQVNKNVSDSKKKVNAIYHYIRWENFSPDDFDVTEQGGILQIKLYGNPVLTLQKGQNFFNAYKNTYDRIVKSAVTTASNIFSDFEAVIPENHALINTKTGHGEMAEEALTMIDKLHGKDAAVVGRDNAKNGADRLVEGTYIQTKYCSSGWRSVNACFDKSTGQFRYFNTNTGKPMQIEVPKDQYAEAVNTFRNKILEGKVPGVSDPNEASNILRPGNLTYQQARNLCKPGTIESLSYDSVTGAVTCSFAFGISFLSAYINSFLQTGDVKESFKAAVAAGIQVFGLSFLSHILVQQVARTSITKPLIPISNFLVEKMGYKAVQTIVNSIRSLAGKSAISGGAAMKSLSKILRSNVVTSAITFAVFSVPDTYNMFAKKISGAQFSKNMATLAGSMAAAAGGTVAAGLAAAKIGGATGTVITPGIGTAIGVVGGFIGGIIGGVATKAVGDSLHEDDATIMSRLFNAVTTSLACEYMLSSAEMNVIIEKLNTIKPKDFQELFKNAMAAENQEKALDDYVRHYFEEVIRTRPAIAEPTPEDIVDFFRDFDGVEPVG